MSALENPALIAAGATFCVVAGVGLCRFFEVSPLLLLCCALLSGYLAGALQADLFKRLWFLKADSTAAMSPQVPRHVRTSTWLVIATSSRATSVIQRIGCARLVEARLPMGRSVKLGSVSSAVKPSGHNRSALLLPPGPPNTCIR